MTSSASANAAIATVELSGVDVHNVTEAETISHIISQFESGLGGRVVTPNVDILYQAAQDADARALLNSADLRIPDGKPLVWSAALAATPLRERVAGSDLVVALIARAAAHDIPIFLLGAAEDVAAAAQEKLKRRHPNLTVARYSPPMGFDVDSAEFDTILEHLSAAGPAIVLVGLPFPIAEQLSSRLATQLPQHWFLGIGAAIAFIAGQFSRSPKWMQRAGLEWVHRLALEPRRLFVRYILHDAPFALQLLTRSALRRRSN